MYKFVIAAVTWRQGQDLKGRRSYAGVDREMLRIELEMRGTELGGQREGKWGSLSLGGKPLLTCWQRVKGCSIPMSLSQALMPASSSLGHAQRTSRTQSTQRPACACRVHHRVHHKADPGSVKLLSAMVMQNPC